MIRTPTIHTRLVPLALVCVGLVASAAASPWNSIEARQTVCTSAAITDVELQEEASVDEIRVMVAPSPRGSAAEVVVDSGEIDRIVRIQETSKALHFAPAMAAAQFRVSVNPVLTAPNDACVERIDLLRAGRVVATVRPQ